MTEYLSRRQAAKACGRCDRTMRNLANRNLGPPFILVGTRPAYPADALAAWIANHSYGAAQ